VARRPKSAPEPTPLHLNFIRASEEEAEVRSNAQRKQLEEMAAAQAERAKALEKAEDALRKRASIRNIALVVVSILAIGLLLELFAIRIAEQRREQAEQELITVKTTVIAFYDRMDVDTKKAMFAVLQTGASHGDVTSMVNLGILYESGRDGAQNYAKAFALFQMAADRGDASAMRNLGILYENGQGVAQDYAKARAWYEKAAAKGDASAMTSIDNLRISEVAGAGRYAEALALQEALAAKVEAVETKGERKPGKETAGILNTVAWYALLASEFPKALMVADRSHALFPDDLPIESNRAHALMFLGREDASRALYLAHKGKRISGPGGQLWESVILEDFAVFRKAGLTHPMMADIEKELGVSP